MQVPNGEKDMIEKLGAMIVQGIEEDRFWVMVNYVIENRRKINELIEQRKDDKANRDKQMLLHEQKLTSLLKQIKNLENKIGKM